LDVNHVVRDVSIEDEEVFCEGGEDICTSGRVVSCKALLRSSDVDHVVRFAGAVG
jgi:hypothetical protein